MTQSSLGLLLVRPTVLLLHLETKRCVLGHSLSNHLSLSPEVARGSGGVALVDLTVLELREVQRFENELEGAARARGRRRAAAVEVEVGAPWPCTARELGYGALRVNAIAPSGAARTRWRKVLEEAQALLDYFHPPLTGSRIFVPDLKK